MKYLFAKSNERKREEAFRNYVSDSLLFLNRNIAKTLGGQWTEVRFADIFKPLPKEEDIAKKEEDTINHFKQKVRGDK